MARISDGDFNNISQLYETVKAGKPKRKQKIRIPIKLPSKNKPTDGKNKPCYLFSLGPREGNTRIVGTSGVSSRLDGQSLPSLQTGQPIGSRIVGLMNSNGIQTETDFNAPIGSSKQKHRGNCYFMAPVIGLMNSKYGQQILQNNVKPGPDGSITVTLPGAVLIRNQYISEGKGSKCEVTGVYHITAEAINKAKKLAGKSYSEGDIRIIALEIAMENYRAEMMKTKENLGLGNETFTTAEGSLNGHSKTDYLSSGYGFDATFLLTGQKADVFMADKQRYENVRRYRDGEFGYITREQMEAREASKNNLYKAQHKGVSEVSSFTNNESEISRKLDKYAGHEQEYLVTVGVRLGKKGSDLVSQKDGGHELLVVKITKDTVYVANPWHPDQIEPIPRAEFENMVTSISSTPIAPHVQDSANNNAQMNTLSSLLSRIQAGSHSGGTHSINGIKPENINQFFGRYNKGVDADVQIDVNQLIRVLNKVSSENLDAEQKARVDVLLKNLASDNEISEQDRAAIRELFEHDK